MLPAPNARPSDDAKTSIATSVDAENIHSVLATQARDRSRVELWAGTLVGATNALLIWTRFPSMHWLAAGFAATVGYGLWGLADRALSDSLGTPEKGGVSRILMKSARVVAGVSGWGAALFAVFSFLTAGLRIFGLPGG